MIKSCYRYLVEHYAALKRNEIMIHATIWMNLENMLSGISQTPKYNYYIVPLI